MEFARICHQLYRSFEGSQGPDQLVNTWVSKITSSTFGAGQGSPGSSEPSSLALRIPERRHSVNEVDFLPGRNWVQRSYRSLWVASGLHTATRMALARAAEFSSSMVRVKSQMRHLRCSQVFLCSSSHWPFALSLDGFARALKDLIPFYHEARTGLQILRGIHLQGRLADIMLRS